MVNKNNFQSESEKKLVEETLTGMKGHLDAALKAGQGLIAAFNKIKDDPRLTPEQRAEFDKQAKAKGFDNLQQVMDDATNKLKKARRAKSN